MKVISGGQTGADQAGLRAAQMNKMATGGFAPKGYITKDGPNIKLLKHQYGLVESKGSYKKRTWENVEKSNATIRLCVDFESFGEKCTLNAINHYKRPCLDIDLLNPKDIEDVIMFLIFVRPTILNIAGNTQDKLGYDIDKMTFEYLDKVFSTYRRRYLKD